MNDTWSMIRTACAFAEAHHAGQRRHNGEPYINHPLRVAGIVMANRIASPGLVCAALLHDVVEDSEGRVTIDMVERLFGPPVANWVDYLTKRSKKDIADKRERTLEYQGRLLHSPDEVKVIKMSDVLDNLRDTRSELAVNHAYYSLSADDKHYRWCQEQAVEKRAVFSIILGADKDLADIVNTELVELEGDLKRVLNNTKVRE